MTWNVDEYGRSIISSSSSSSSTSSSSTSSKEDDRLSSGQIRAEADPDETFSLSSPEGYVPGPLALVTGGSRGIGLSVVRRLHQFFNGTVLMTSRDAVFGEKVVDALEEYDQLFPKYHQLDTMDAQTRSFFLRYLRRTFGGIDVLVNAAGTYCGRLADVEDSDSEATFGKHAEAALNNNFFGTVLLFQMLYPLFKKNARIVNLSSQCGLLSALPPGRWRREFQNLDHLTVNKLSYLMTQYYDSVRNDSCLEDGWGVEPYCVSKLAVAAFTHCQQKVFDAERPARGIIVNTYNPGSISTRLNNYEGVMRKRTAAVNIVQMVAGPRKPKTVRDRGKLLWFNMSLVDWRWTEPITDRYPVDSKDDLEESPSSEFYSREETESEGESERKRRLEVEMMQGVGKKKKRPGTAESDHSESNRRRYREKKLKRTKKHRAKMKKMGKKKGGKKMKG